MGACVCVFACLFVAQGRQSSAETNDTIDCRVVLNILRVVACVTLSGLVCLAQAGRYCRSYYFSPIPSLRLHISLSLNRCCPPCQDYEECFNKMSYTPAYQNVMSRMVTGYYAYHGDTHICLEKDNGTANGGECSEDLESVIRGACNLNFVAIRCLVGRVNVYLPLASEAFVFIAHDVPASCFGDGDMKRGGAHRVLTLAGL